MSSKWKICKKCGEIYIGENNSRAICPDCAGDLFLIETNMPPADVFALTDISTDFNFTKSMMELYDTNPIEYQLKIGHFKQQAENNTNQVRCPKCQSSSIATGARGVNWIWGLIGASKTVNRCANCGYTWKP